MSALLEWLDHDWTHAAALLVGVASTYALAWGAVRSSIERVTGRPLPRTRVVLVLDVLADLAVNVPGAINRVMRASGRPLFLPAPPDIPRDTTVPPPPEAP